MFELRNVLRASPLVSRFRCAIAQRCPEANLTKIWWFIYTIAMDGFWQNVAWQKMDFDRSSSVEVKSTPEPTSLIGLLGLSLFGIISRSQGFLCRKNDAK